MSDTARSKYTFLPYVRRGLAAALGGSAVSQGRVQLPVQLKLSGAEDQDTVDVALRLYGPADVIGIDPAEVIRTEPRHQSAGFDPNHFPVVEFDTPDFPWMFTPQGADAQGRLAPWLCLVVVRDQAPNTLAGDRKGPLAVLECELGELPDPREAHAWAHAQVMREGLETEETGAARNAVEAAITGAPSRSLSRLMCPRRLAPNTAYVACVVPTFEAGRLAGLGLPVTPECLADLDWAWPAPAGAAPRLITLPVYHHWRFSTGAGSESFEALVRRLERRQSLEGVGELRLDVGAPGWRLPNQPGAQVALDGALVPAQRSAPKSYWTDGQRDAFQAGLRDLLNVPATSAEALVAPPIYGQHHAGRGIVPAPGKAPTWLGDLNLDPACRVAAGLGAMVVRARQEELMAQAWEQVETIERENQQRRQAQLAVEVGSNLHERLSALAPSTLLQITAPAHDRIAGASSLKRGAADGSVGDQVRASALPDAALSSSFRRLTRKNGPIAQRLAVGGKAPRSLERLIEDPTAAAPERSAQSGFLSLETLAEALRAAAPSPDGGSRTPIELLIEKAMTGPRTSPTKARPAEAALESSLHQAAAAQQARLSELSGAGQSNYAPPLEVEEIALALKQRLDPAARVPEAVGALVEAPATMKSARGSPAMRAQGGDPLSPVMAAPSFATPMYRPLQEMHDMLLPGLEKTPPNTLAVLKTNPRFIEAFMVGLNHEFARELLWREYPTDQRGTYFRHFWDARGGEVTSPDLEPIDTWTDNSVLGAHLGSGGGGADLALLIRGDLLRRYPDALIYALKAKPDGSFPTEDGAEIRLPRFTAARAPDITFIGFDLTEARARGEDGGWYFVLQEQPAAPRFGLDPADMPEDPSRLKAWSDVSWGHLADTRQALAALKHAPIDGPLAEKTIGAPPALVTWGKNAGHMARITLQRTYRIAVHADALLAQSPAH